MSSRRAHFDGKVLVPVEALNLAPGTEVEFKVLEKTPLAGGDQPTEDLGYLPDGTKRKRKAGMAKGMFTMSADFDEPLEEFKEYM